MSEMAVLAPITSGDELDAVLSERPEFAPTILMIGREGCPKSAKVGKFYEDKYNMIPSVRLQLAQAEDEDSTEARALCDRLHVTRTPVFVLFQDGQRVLDFVAETPGALFYGIEDCRLLISAYAEK